MSPTNGNGAEINGKAQYKVHEKPGLPLRAIRVICIGAGLSGIYLGIRLPMATSNVELVIYEKNKDVGGTWFENKYPGCACDVPAHRYCYTFEPNPHWSNFFAPAAEIQAYFASAAQKYDAAKYIKLEHKVVGAVWNETAGKWKLKVQNSEGVVFDDECDVLVNAMGVLNNWKWPSIPGLNDFEGELLHSASYDASISLVGKNVAVIGSGSSGIQIIPNIQPDVGRLGAYLRSSTWIVPPFGSEHIKVDENGDPNYAYSDEERKMFASDPEAFLDYRRMLEKDVSSRFRMFMTADPSQVTLRPFLVNYMKSRLAKRPELATSLIPDWPVGCRRLTPGVGFLEALCEPNCDPIFSDIAQISATGITTVDGEHKEYDIIICATGFDVSYGARFPFEGRDGRKLDEKFHAAPSSYLAVGLAGFPNYFSFNGPNAPVGAGSLVPATEAQGDYILKAINKLQRQNLQSMVPKDECVREFVEHTDTYMPRTVWSTGCRSWYKNGKINGRVTALWPGSGLHFIDSLEDPRWEDYDYTFLDSTNRFSYLGDGFTELETSGADRTVGLSAATDRMLSHPALRRAGEKTQKVMVAAKSAEVIKGRMAVF